MLQLTIIIIFTFILLSILFFSLKNGITPTPSNSIIIRNVVRILKKQEIKRDSQIYELGSGWGSLALPIAAAFPEAQVTGIESSHIPYLFSRIRKFMSKSHNLSLRNQDFLKVPIHEADILVCYLHRKGIQKVHDHLNQHPNSNIMIISIAFAFPDRKPSQTFQLNDLYRSKVYIYK